MGKHADKFLQGRADQMRMYLYANLAVVGACLADYLFLGHPYALETLVILVVLVNGFALWQQNHDLNDARKRDLEDETEAAQNEAAREARLKSRNLR